ncbi:autotransporter domain-containing protein, partial [Brevundimonas sp.]|uniref:autotransporter domain-containing protein n=1 Tax=Brevundimonas sp. TaxID=1871086 RepID=UPI003AF60152
MSRFMRSAAAAALTLAAGVALAGTANAQSYDRLVVFGDSLSDNGNLFLLTGGTQPPAPFYFQGRFSTGPVFVELLGFNLGRFAAGDSNAGSINYAFGGARTDLAGAPPGMRTQLNAYLGGGGTFDSNDLVSILGGANNIFQGLPAAGASINPAGAIQVVSLSAAADINLLVDTVAAAGAGTILVSNLPKLSLTPQFAGTTAAPLADYAVTTFNGAIFNGLSTVAANRPGTNIILMDLFKIGDTIAGNPTAFGVTNVTQPCFNQVALTLCSNPDDYFYLDGVHPTAAGHRAIASLANDYLYYGDRGAATAHQGELSMRQREDSLDMGSDALSGWAAWEPGHTTLDVSLTGDTTDVDARGIVPDAKVEGQGIRLAVDHSISEGWRMGFAGSYRQAETVAGPTRFDSENFSFDAFVGWRSGPLFANVTAGAARDTYDDILRSTGVGPVVHTAETEGYSRGVRVQGGTWFDFGGIALSPRVAVTWASTDVSGYIEQGVAAQYAYEDRTVEGITGEVTLRAESAIEGVTFY